jgi:flagellar basal-body rod protein FlgB
MPGLFGDVTSVVLQQALGGLSLRQQVITNNIANVDTPGFKASEVTFEDQLLRAVGQQDDAASMLQSDERHLNANGSTSIGPAAIITRDAATRSDGNSVDVEREMAKLAETNLSYSALTTFEAKRLGILRSIITDGRG